MKEHTRMAAYFGTIAALSALPVTIFLWSLMSSRDLPRTIIWASTPLCAGIVAGALLLWALSSKSINRATRVGLGLGIAVALGTLMTVAIFCAAFARDSNMAALTFIGALEFIGWYAALVGILAAWLTNILAMSRRGDR